MSKYRPMMPKEEIERRRVWQEKIYQCHKMLRGAKLKVDVLGKEFLVLPGVFAPLWESSLLAKAVRKEAAKCDSVLDLGTGTGIQAVLAAANGARVLATDINPAAIRCASLNVTLNNLSSKVKVLRSNLFSKIDGEFDLILFNPPFRWFKPGDALERSNLDENYRTLARFFSEAASHLKENGRLLIAFSTSGDIRYFRHLIRTNYLMPEVVARQKRNGWEYFVYRLRPANACSRNEKRSDKLCSGRNLRSPELLRCKRPSLG